MRLVPLLVPAVLSKFACRSASRDKMGQAGGTLGWLYVQCVAGHLFNCLHQLPFFARPPLHNQLPASNMLVAQSV